MTDSLGSIPGISKRVVSMPQGLDRLWDLPSLLFNGHWGLFPQKQSGQAVNVNTNFHQAQRLGMATAILVLPPYAFSWHRLPLHLDFPCFIV